MSRTVAQSHTAGAGMSGSLGYAVEENQVEDYGPETYGERWAEVYDDWVMARFGEEATRVAMDALVDLAADRRVLELAIGTGRIALPLADRGLEVHGIDASEEMVARLRDKPGGGAIPVTIGDFADVGVEGEFGLVFIAFNTFFALLTQEEQLRCFQNVAEHLADGGLFVIEAFVPDLNRFEDGQTVRALQVRMEEVSLEASRHDPIAQTVVSQEVEITEEGVRFRPVHLRYAWPSELDLMARLAGLELRDRWGGWERSPFTASSGVHVSVYARSS